MFHLEFVFGEVNRRGAALFLLSLSGPYAPSPPPSENCDFLPNTRIILLQRLLKQGEEVRDLTG